MLVGPNKYLKQIIRIKHSWVKNPNWPETNQLAIYKRYRGVELRTTENKSSQRSGQDLNSGPPNYKPSALTARLSHLIESNAFYLLNSQVTYKQVILSKKDQKKRLTIFLLSWIA